MTHSFFPKLEHSYILDEGRVGILKFIGETKFAKGTWYGFALIDSVGKHDGEVRGKRYFKTSNHPPRGVFVRRGKILAEAEEKVGAGKTKQKAQSALQNWKPAKYESLTNGNQSESTEQFDSQYYLTNLGQKRKLGPRQIGKIEGWQPAVYENSAREYFSDGNGVVIAENKQQVDDSHTNSVKKKKLGPREIGRISSEWKPAKYSTPDTGKFLARMRTLASEYGIDKQSDINRGNYTTESAKNKKLGPREIGRVTDWKPAKYDLPKTGNFLAKRPYLVPGIKPNEIAPRQQVDTHHYITENGQKRKLGPREIGRIESWQPAKYDLSDTGAFLEKRKRSFLGKTVKESKEHTRTKTYTQDYVTEACDVVNESPGEIGHNTMESYPEKDNIADKEKSAEMKPDLVSEQIEGEVWRHEQIKEQPVNTDNRLTKLPLTEVGGVVCGENVGTEVAEADSGEFIDKISRNLKALAVQEHVVPKGGEVEQPASWLPANVDMSEQVLSDSEAEEPPQDKRSTSDSIYVEHPQESVNVSASSSSEETTDELRF